MSHIMQYPCRMMPFPRILLHFWFVSAKAKCRSAKYCICKLSSQRSVCTEVCQCTELCENTDFDEVRGVDSDPEDD